MKRALTRNCVNLAQKKDLLFSPPEDRRLHQLCASKLSETDEKFLEEAIEHAKQGFGETFPNPAVGCIITSTPADGGEPISLGRGFHPRSGHPHAEVFALLEAANHLEDGVAAAQSVVKQNPAALAEKVQQLSDRYGDKNGGPEDLLEDCFDSTDEVTAYVTLEPCCHFGKTPPCAVSLALAGVDRVVVGFRDPNPRVDGGGVELLKTAGIQVDVLEQDHHLHRACADLVTNFANRITPRDDLIPITGKMRRALRAMANRRKAENEMDTMRWTGPTIPLGDDGKPDVEGISLPPAWMEELDALLWKKELVNLQLNSSGVGKRKYTEKLGKRISEALGAHVAQSLGHTILLYRPGIPPILDLEELSKTVDS